MKEKIITIIKFFVFLAAGVFLLWLVYKDMNTETLFNELSKVNYWWIGLSVIISLASHYMRALRWKILMKPLNAFPSTLNTFFSVMVMYLANMALPRMGEISRCAVMKRYENISFTQLVGTVLVERVADLMLLCVLLVLVLLTQLGTMLDFLNQNPTIKNNLSNILSSSPTMIISAIVGIGLLLGAFRFRDKVRNTSVYQKFSAFAKKFMEGIATVKNLENKYDFVVQTIIIWVLYFLMLYVCFFAFDATKNITISQGLALLVLSSFGMVAPVQGGIGAWHFMIIKGLLLFGVAELDGMSFALVVHTSMVLLIMVAGFISLIALPIVNKTKKFTELKVEN